MGPLDGVKIVELAGIGPAPFAAMMLADMGAEVVRIDRPGDPDDPAPGPLGRSRRSVAVDLKRDGAAEVVLRLVESADGLLEGFRPGVAERLGVGPDVCRERNPRLVYGRMTGWGQEGPLASDPGHDINYIAVTGALHAIGRAGEVPLPPINLLGDFGGGGMLLAFGMACGLFEASRSGEGQVIDAAMVDGTALLMTMIYGFRQAGMWSDERGTNLLDTGAPFYNVYETADGKYVSIGSNEPKFYAELRRLAGLDDPEWDVQHDHGSWPERTRKLADVFRSKSRAEWCAIMEGAEVCFAPVLSMGEAPDHPHNRARGTFVDHHGSVQPAPAPRFSRTPGAIASSPPRPGAHTDEALVEWGFTPAEVQSLRGRGVVH